ncbi:MAG: heme-copper oxidase subunit III, partial [Bacteroidota bacterium]
MQPIAQPMPEQTKIATLKIVLWVAMASITMLFAGLTSGLLVRLSEGNWEDFKIPSAFYVSTGIIILSSITMFLA